MIPFDTELEVYVKAINGNYHFYLKHGDFESYISTMLDNETKEELIRQYQQYCQDENIKEE